MTIHPRALAAISLSLVVAGTLSVTAQQAISTAPRSIARATVGKGGLVKTKADGLTSIQGNALNSTNGPLNDVTVRLRDARWGRIVDTQYTDKSGLFAFKAIDPGSYIIEVMANNESVLAASQLLNINAGEAVSAVVKLPFRVPPFAGLIGQTNMPSAAAVAGQAAVSGIAAIVPTVSVSPTI